ncbi:hypothetical protein G7Y89_g3106 [Cudoniella acicularis]|uniref:Uncharacterized protein n=1 Tax=Cudoniella acicularis TaxID=354080 RepID=A0A8H4W8Q3_9HELO|nr:hypothetical protein G7Y89_g3106 [Cudoniella acicularis]
MGGPDQVVVQVVEAQVQTLVPIQALIQARNLVVMQMPRLHLQGQALHLALALAAPQVDPDLQEDGSDPPPGTTRAEEDTRSAEGAAKGAWERAREETKRKEEERKAREAAQRKKEEIERKLREAREKEQREREAREKRQKEDDAREAREREVRERRRKEDEARAKEAREREARERRQREDEARAKAKIQADLEQELEKEREKVRQMQKEKEKEEERQRELAEKERELQKEKERLREKEREAQREKDREKAKLWEKRKEETKRLQKEREKERERAAQVEKDKAAQAEKDKAAQLEKEKTAAATKPVSSTYAFSSTGEKTNPWPMGRPVSPTIPRSQPPSPTKRPPVPTANTYRGTEEDAFSYRPYDKPKQPMHKKAPSSVYSESSYAASQSTSRTTPPPSRRGPYTTKDPDKIVIKAVYAFNNTFQKTPTSQLVSGVGSVTDGLILRITTEGLFIDDDVRGVPQREWDVKAWTMKLVEVWCPSFRQGPAGNSASARVGSASALKYNPVRRLWGMDKDKAATSEETDALLIDMLQLCQNGCRARSTSSGSSAYSASSAGSYDDRSSVSDSAYGSSVGSSSSGNKRTDNRGVNLQTGELKSARLHVLRASIRDQEGKKYVFIISEEESWKVPVGLQRLRRGTQVRALGVSGMSTADARGTLEHLQWV